MSLSTFLEIGEIRDRFIKEFPKPKFSMNLPILANPRSERYGLIGTAFDYLLRFYVKRLNPKAIERAWVAESLVRELDVINEWEILNIARSIFVNAKRQNELFLRNGRVTDSLLTSALQLAQLDTVFRAGYFDSDLGEVDQNDIADLRQLIKITEAKQFKAKKICILNPTFGTGSELIGGADADLIIDDTIIEIKTIKNLKLEREHYHQLIGYYILHRIGGAHAYPRKRRIRNLAIYFSRYGYFYSFKTSQLFNEDRFKKFMNWFVRKAISYNQL